MFSSVITVLVLWFVIAIATITLFLAAIVPFVGALTRYRAHYSPRGLRLEPEEGVQPPASPAITSLFAMFSRIYRIEGWNGFYRGLMPIILLTPVLAILSLFCLSIVGIFILVGNLNPLVGTLATMLLLSPAYLPCSIMLSRTITTPYKLPCFNLSHSLRALLTPEERRRPWILYLTPGLFVAQVSHATYIILGLGTVKRWLIPELMQPQPLFNEGTPIRLAIFLVVALSSTIVLAPLEVIALRLSIQRNHGLNAISQEEINAEETLEYAGINEDVVSLRTDQKPYTGVVDCAKTIITEEGWGVLYRAWWWTMLSLVSFALSPTPSMQ